MTQKTGDFERLLNPPDNPHCIIRFDHRDTGLSSAFTKPDDDTPVYTLDDMAGDVLGLIKHLELKSVHLVGSSLGGPISWLAASQIPDIARSLALVVTSPVGRIQDSKDNLPTLHLEGSYLLGEAYDPPIDPDDDEGWIKCYMGIDLALSTQPPTEEERAESRMESEITYYRQKESGTMWKRMNHSDAAGVRWPREALKKIKCPTVVIHAAKDQIFPFEHAKALRDDVEGATLVVIEDCGHEMPIRARPQMAEAILANARKGE